MFALRCPARFFPQSVDMWNIGHVVHILIVGVDPEFEKPEREICQRKDQGDLNFAIQKWNNISEEAQVAITYLTSLHVFCIV